MFHFYSGAVGNVSLFFGQVAIKFQSHCVGINHDLIDGESFTNLRRRTRPIRLPRLIDCLTRSRRTWFRKGNLDRSIAVPKAFVCSLQNYRNKKETKFNFIKKSAFYEIIYQSIQPFTSHVYRVFNLVEWVFSIRDNVWWLNCKQNSTSLKRVHFMKSFINPFSHLLPMFIESLT